MFDSPVIVLIYHRVTTLPTDPQLLAVTPDNFREQMKFLKENLPVLLFDEDWSDVKEPSVVVTFDDGYADNALEALPILEEVGVPATFFVTTGTIGTNREFWWDELERVILGEWSFPPFFKLIDSRFGREWPTATTSDRYMMYKGIHPLMKKVDYSIREEWLNQLRSWVNAGLYGRETHRPMIVEDLRLLGRNKWVTIGAHTINHTPLSTLSYDKQRGEIGGSKEQLERWLGKKIEVFSYPFGTKKDYNSDSIRICRELGFKKAASNFPGQAHRWTDPYQIPRQLVRNWSLEVFKEKMRRFSVL
jgi:peptidoglycan/xylan/chitin deacetylase (PgdA/CDA1 family)